LVCSSSSITILQLPVSVCVVSLPVAGQKEKFGNMLRTRGVSTMLLSHPVSLGTEDSRPTSMMRPVGKGPFSFARGLPSVEFGVANTYPIFPRIHVSCCCLGQTTHLVMKHLSPGRGCGCGWCRRRLGIKVFILLLSKNSNFAFAQLQPLFRQTKALL
jgi:hypothetical protein